MAAFVLFLAAVSFVVDLASIRQACTLVLIAIFVVTKDTSPCRTPLLPGWSSLPHLKTYIACDVLIRSVCLQLLIARCFLGRIHREGIEQV